MKDMVGRRVRSWDGFEGTIIKWEPLGVGMTDVLIESSTSSRRVWYASHTLKPIDGKGSLPTREQARAQADRTVARQLGHIQKDVAREITEHKRWPGMEFGKGMLGRSVTEALEEVESRRNRRSVWSELDEGEQARAIQRYGQKYALSAAEVRTFLSRVSEKKWDDITRALEKWREKNGLPAETSPLVRGVLCDAVSGKITIADLESGRG